MELDSINQETRYDTFYTPSETSRNFTRLARRRRRVESLRSNLAASRRDVDNIGISNLLLLVSALLVLSNLDARSGRVLAIEQDGDPARKMPSVSA